MKTLGQIQPGEGLTAFLMLTYSFLAMASYNIVKPITRSKFIDSLGADNIPYVQLLAAAVIGLIMVAYAWVIGRLPRRWNLPIAQCGIVVTLVGFWFLFKGGGAWVPVLFFLAGLILGILLISQFWTLANLIYDARQAKRLFGFIGAGAPLGGIAGSLVTARYVKTIGSVNLLLVSAAVMTVCVVIVSIIVRRMTFVAEAEPAVEKHREERPPVTTLLRRSKHLQIIALVISFAAIGATIIEQQLNLAAEATQGQESAVAEFLAEIQAWTSTLGFIVQILLTSRIHRFLGIGFALMILPVSLGSTAFVMLLNAALWAPGMARVIDQSLRYTVDKTSREILFMPLPGDIKTQAKPFVDVTVDRFAKGFAAVLALVLIKPWGLHLNWQQLSYASLAMTAVWIFMAVRARRGYIEAFRRSIASREMEPSEIRLASPDLSTVEALLEELAAPEERRVLYAIDILDSLGKKNLVTPLILHHESPRVRVRALELLNGSTAGMPDRWLPHVRRLMTDSDIDVRIAAVGALALMTSIDSAELVRPALSDPNPRMAMTAAMLLARIGGDEDRAAAQRLLGGIAADPRDSSVEVRLELAEVLGHIPDERFRRLLIPLLGDAELPVALRAVESVRRLGVSDPLFVPALVPLLRNPYLKGPARQLLAGFGESALDLLAHFLQDPEEDAGIRRQIPATIALFPVQRSVDVLLRGLQDSDGLVRFSVLTALERMRRHDGLRFDPAIVERQILRECERATVARKLHAGTPAGRSDSHGRLLAVALSQKADRAADRVLRLLGLIHPWNDMTCVRLSIMQGGASGARALEYLDNFLAPALRRRVLTALEAESSDRAVGQADAESIRSLIADTDPVIASAAVLLAGESQSEVFRADIERLFGGPEGHHPWVVEAASWVLSGSRLPDAGDARLPVVEIAERLAFLPLFAGVSLDDISRVAAAGRRVGRAAGERLLDGDSASTDVEFLVAGQAVRKIEWGATLEIDAPAQLNFQEVLQGVHPDPVRAQSPSISLVLSFETMRGLMAGMPGLIEGILRMLCLRFPEEIGSPVAPRPGAASWTTDRFDGVRIALALESYTPFAGIPRNDLLAVAALASEHHPPDGTVLFNEMAPPALYFVGAGTVVLEDPDGAPAIEAREGDAIGLFQMLSGIPLVRRATCRGTCSVLRIGREDFLDLLMEQPNLLREILARLFGPRPV